jgi:chromate reductase, NAD(P)H dehydrogenase (quinone)
MRSIELLAISGSLRYRSSNTRLVETIASRAQAPVNIDIFSDLHQLPHFNPDLDPSDDPFVQALTSRMRVADGFLISTPEYAHGIPGSLKNGLDWLVGTDAFIEKPFALLHACDRSTHAPQSLIEILSTMSGIHVIDADLTIDLRSNPARSEEILLAESSNAKIQLSIGILSQFILDRRSIKV